MGDAVERCIYRGFDIWPDYLGGMPKQYFWRVRLAALNQCSHFNI